jgi:hypothetical protein
MEKTITNSYLFRNGVDFMAEQEPVVPDCPVPEIEYGYSPFELELNHEKHSEDVCLDFYYTVMECTASELNRFAARTILLNPISIAWLIFIKVQTDLCLQMCSTWFKHDDPTPLAMDGNKLKVNFNVANDMMFNGLSACLRVFDEKEKAMMANVRGDPVWRCLAGLELAVG